MGRREYRREIAAERRRASAQRQRMIQHDGAMLRRQRERLRRRHGNPSNRRQALVDWVVSVNMRRGEVE